MRQIQQSISITCSPEQIFRTLHTPSEICMWWNARTAIVMPRLNGLWTAAWGKDEDAPDYIVAARLKVFEPPKRMVMGDYEYQSTGTPLAFATQMETEFLIESQKLTLLTVTQTGFPDSKDADEFYNGCCQGWKNTLQSIVEYFQGSLNI